MDGVSNHSIVKDLFRSIQIADTWQPAVMPGFDDCHEMPLGFGRRHGLLRGQSFMRGGTRGRG
jgi:hypothetical protein